MYNQLIIKKSMMGFYGHKLFEVLHVSIWYLAMRKVYAVGFFGAISDGNIGFFIPFSFALIVAAFIGRARQLHLSSWWPSPPK